MPWGGGYAIYGDYTFAQAGVQTVTVDLCKADSAFRGTSLSVPVYVTVGSQLSLAANPVTSTELSSGGMVDVANFTDTDPGAVSGNFTATVAWGSTTETGLVVPTDDSGFNVYALASPLGSGSDAAFSVTLANAVDGASGSTT